MSLKCDHDTSEVTPTRFIPFEQLSWALSGAFDLSYCKDL